MIKLISKFLVVLSFITAGVANAGLITSDLTEDNYATIGQLDWAWASIINTNGVAENDIYGPADIFDPELHVTWRYATNDELSVFIEQILNAPDDYLALFTFSDDQGNLQYKHAVQFWNSEYKNLDSGGGGNTENFKKGEINSQVSTGSVTYNPASPSNWYYETFYVRNTQVPEPSTLLIFAIALIALSMKKRAIK